MPEPIDIQFAGAGTPLTQNCVQAMCEQSGIGIPEFWSVVSVETSGCGFLPDRRPKILFERHVFSRLTSGRFDAEDPDVSAPSPGGYGPSGTYQYDRLNAAMQLDARAALKSASWGIAQIMGENYRAAGFTQPEDMVRSMIASEDDQLQAMVEFMKAMQLVQPLKSHDWTGFARRYNGPNYAANNYDGLLQHFYERYSSGTPPALDVRSAQIYLTYNGYNIGGIDGVLGEKTRVAILAFQAKAGLPQTGTVGSELLTALEARTK